MRSRARLVAVGLSALLLSACSQGAGTNPKPAATSKPSDYVATGAWDAAYMRTIRGLAGSFRSLVVGTPCTEPITRPCVVGGAQISDAGVFTLARDSARYEHHAFGLGADPSEGAGYRVVLLLDGDAFLSVMGRTSRGGCWAKTYSPTTFGTKWPVMPIGFDVLTDAEPVDDPAAAPKAMRLTGMADVGLVLQYLGLRTLYHDVGGHYHWTATRVPIELRLGADGLPAGFAIDGARIAEYLVGPDPEDNNNAPAAFSSTADDRAFDAEVRHALAPMRAEFTLEDLGHKPKITAPPREKMIPHHAEGDDPCPAGR